MFLTLFVFFMIQGGFENCVSKLSVADSGNENENKKFIPKWFLVLDANRIQKFCVGFENILLPTSNKID
jgi:hypothetical protein